MTETIFEIIQKPFIQVLVFLLLTIISIFIIGPKSADQMWNIAGIVFIGFMLVNALLICVVPNSWSYFFYSLGFSMLYLVCIAILIPASMRLLKITGSEESAMIFIFILYHPVCLLFVLFFKWAYFKIF